MLNLPLKNKKIANIWNGKTNFVYIWGFESLIAQDKNTAKNYNDL